jgi:hypothetical protein
LNRKTIQRRFGPYSARVVNLGESLREADIERPRQELKDVPWLKLA